MVICKKCGGPHPLWECHATAARIAAYEAFEHPPQPLTVRAVHAAPIASPKRGKGRPRTITDMKAYKAQKERERRAKAKS